MTSFQTAPPVTTPSQSSSLALTNLGALGDTYRDTSHRFLLDLPKAFTTLQNQLTKCLKDSGMAEGSGHEMATQAIKVLSEVFSEIFPSWQSTDASLKDACNGIYEFATPLPRSELPSLYTMWLQQKASTTRHALLTLITTAERILIEDPIASSQDQRQLSPSHSMIEAVFGVLQGTLQVVPDDGKLTVEAIGAYLKGPEDRVATHLALEAFLELAQVRLYAEPNLAYRLGMAEIYGGQDELSRMLKKASDALMPHVVEQVTQRVGAAVQRQLIESLPGSSSEELAEKIRISNPRFLGFLKPALDESVTHEERTKVVAKACSAVAQGFCDERLRYVMERCAGITTSPGSERNFVECLVGLSD